MFEILKFIASTCIFAICILFFMAVAAEFAVGCGEKEYFSDHTWKSKSCLFIDAETVYGRW